MLSIWHQSLVLLVAVQVSIGQVGRQEPAGWWGCALPSPVGTVTLYPNELSKAKAKGQGSRGGSEAQEEGPAEASPSSLSAGSRPTAAIQSCCGAWPKWTGQSWVRARALSVH